MDAVTIVSGLPRSGTSMMMQMLQAGGMEIVTDDIREADEHNPRGYLEYEKVKHIESNSEWLNDCRGKALKMISNYLYSLDKRLRYQVIFMKRDMNEILRSQRTMLKNLGWEENVSEGEIEERFENHLRQVMIWLARQPNIDVLYLTYKEVLKEPIKKAEELGRFLQYKLDTVKMAATVDQSMYRNRK